MDKPELIEKYDAKLHQLMTNMRHDGIRQEVIHFILNQAARQVEMAIIAQAELEPDAPESLEKGH